MRELVTHRQRVAEPVEERQIDGRAFLVAPVVAAREGVMNGELLPLDELGHYFTAWEDAPAPIGHPSVGGLSVSARTPDQVMRAPGRFYDVRMDGPALKGNIYLDVAKAEALGGDALTALAMLRSGQPMDVSTAYWRDVEAVSGSFNGVPYSGIQRNLRPDHLALLPGGTGACSWADGCGAPRVNERHDMNKTLIEGGNGPFLQANIELSLDDAMTRVADAWYARFEKNEGASAWVKEVWPDFAVVRRNAKTFRYPYTMADDGTVDFGEPEEVYVVYQPVTPAANTNNTGGMTMNVQEQTPPCGDCPPETPPAANEADALTGAPAEAAVAATSPELDALLAVVSEYGGVDAFREALLQFKTNAETERADLIAVLTANKANAFDGAELNAMSTAQLRKLDASLRPADYSGRGLPVANRASDGWVPYVAPEVK